MKTSHAEGMVLITGASGGLGAEFAKLFAADNYDLVLVARSKEKMVALATELQSKHDVFIKVIEKDLSKLDAAREVILELEKEHITIDILVNNAGFGAHGVFYEIPYQDDLEQIQLNITTLSLLTKLLLPHMVQEKAGRILNISSTAAFFPGPYMAVYYASKAYIFSFSQAIAEEVRGTGVTVTTLCPGPTETDFAQRASVKEKRIFRGKLMKAHTVAIEGYEGLMLGKRLVVPGWRNKLQVVLSRVTPPALSANILKMMQE